MDNRVARYGEKYHENLMQVSALQMDIADFEAWQQTPDETEDLSAIHVALLLSKENRIIPPETV